MGKTLRGLFEATDDSRLLGAIFDTIGPVATKQMPPEHRVFLEVYGTAGKVDCGGLECLLHDGGEDFKAILKAFKTIDASRSVADIQRIMAAFPDGTSPEDDRLSVRQKRVLKGHYAIWTKDILPELATWVRARREAFVGIRETWLTKVYWTDPPFPAPPASSDGRTMAGWLHYRNVNLEFAERPIKRGSKVLETFRHHRGLPKGPLTIVSAEFDYARRDNPVSLEALAHWSGRGSLKNIALPYCRLTDSALQLLSLFPSLRSLDLRCARIASEGLQNIAVLQSLETLNLIAIPVSEKALRSVSTLRRLRSLTIGPVVGGDGSLAALRGHSGLKYLAVHDSNLSSAAARTLKSMPRLREVSIGEVRDPKEAIRVLGKLDR